jgi:hypothetical protein
MPRVMRGEQLHATLYYGPDQKSITAEPEIEGLSAFLAGQGLDE